MEIIDSKYKDIEATYGKAAVEFARKIMSVFAKSRGVDHVLWNSIRQMYSEGEIVIYNYGTPTEELKGKILVQRGDFVSEDEPYTRNAAFGFITDDGIPIFAEVPFSLYEWNGEVNSIATALLDMGRSFHNELVTDHSRKWNANNSFNMVRSLEIANRLVLEADKNVSLSDEVNAEL